MKTLEITHPMFKEEKLRIYDEEHIITLAVNGIVRGQLDLEAARKLRNWLVQWCAKASTGAPT